MGKIDSQLFFAFVFSILVVAMHADCVSCQCLETERYHLLRLKGSVKILRDQHSDGKLVTWNNQTLDCCLWKGVGCSEDGKIVSLDLSGEGITEGVNDSSSLFKLKYLERLNLAFNAFNSTFPAKFDELSNLNYLNLSYSGFSGQIPTGISRLKNLQTLDISNDAYVVFAYDGHLSSLIQLENPNLDALIRNLSNLRGLHLNGVNISAKDDNWGRAISSSLPNLRVLSLSECHLKGSIDFSLSNLRHLSDIRLAHNHLHGVFPPEIFHLPSLRAIDLSMNKNLEGSFPEISKNSSLEELLLSSTNFSGGLPADAIGNLKSLSRLDISGCRLSGAIPESLSNLTQLTYLDLSDNMFVGSLPSFTLLTKLEQLHLTNINLEGSFPEISKNSSLEKLLLSSTNFSGGLPADAIGNLKSLSRLEMSSCRLSGAIPESLSNLTQLTYLDLSDNMFVGSLPSFTLLTKLEELYLGNNSLSGTIPMSVFQIPSLRVLHLDSNQFSDISNEHLNMSSSSSQLSTFYLFFNNINGPFPHVVLQFTQLSDLGLSGNNLSGPVPDFSSLKNLSHLYLSSNNFDGPFPKLEFDMIYLEDLDLSSNNLSGLFPNSLFKFKNLLTLDLSHNNFSSVDDNVDVPSSLPNISDVSMASCGLRSFPGFLRYISNLYNLDLSKNQMSGEIPNWIWEGTNHNLNYLKLSHNFLESMGRPVVNVPTIRYLDLHSNRLRGELPFFPRDVHFLSLSNNHFNGSIPESICNASGIQVLDLSNNSLSGAIPQCLSALNDSLSVLNLGMNNLNGTIPDALFQAGCRLETLDLNGNRLTGRVPKSLVNCKELQVLNLGNNQIDGTFPCWLQEISSLRVLVLRSNKFHGELGCPEANGSWPMLQIVDLSSNSFNGNFSAKWFLSWKGMITATEFNSNRFSKLGFYYQDVVTLRYKGNVVTLEKILTIFASFDLSNNNFEGAIPMELGNLRALHGLNLSRNNFRGEIPASLGSLKQLESLDLSRNKLSGPIPQQLADLNFLSVLNLSFNQLEGRVPMGTQFDNLCEDSFLGNKRLVGPQVERKCNDDGKTVASSAAPLHDNSTRPEKAEVRWELIGGEAGFFVGLGIVIGSLVFWERWREWYFDRVDQVLLRFLCHQTQRRPNRVRRRRGGN